MKLWIILLAAILMMGVASVTGREDSNSSKAVNESSVMNSSALRELILSSQTHPETYLFTLDMNQRIVIINATQSNKTESQAISTRSFSVAALNSTAMALKMVLASLSVPEGQEENASVMATEMYLLNNTLYMKIDGNWTRMALVGLSLEGLWKQENEIALQREQLNNSSISFLGYENVNGIDCYKIKIIPDLKAYAALQETQLGSSISSTIASSNMTSPNTTSSLNLSSLFNNTSMSEISWISRETVLPVKTEISMNMTLSPEALGLPETKAGRLEMRIDTLETMMFSGFNRSIEITLPEGAKEAKAFPALLFTQTNSSSTNTTSVNSTINSTPMAR